MDDHHGNEIEGFSIEELRVPVEFKNVWGYPKIVDEMHATQVLPTPAPIWLLGVCFFIPGAVFLWLFTFGKLNPWRFPGDISQWILAFTICYLASVSACLFFWLIVHLDRKLMNLGPFMVLDKFSGVLSLPRYKAEVLKKDLLAVIELHGTIEFRDRDGRQTSKGHFTHVSIIYRDESGVVVRCPIIADTNSLCPSKRVSLLLREYFGASFYRIERDRKSPFLIKD